MRVFHLNCGTMLGAVDHCLLIETNRQLVLVDAGFGLNCIARPDEVLGRSHRMTRPALRAEETAIRQVEALGYAPTDVRHIVLTHLDYDHAGGLADFPWATVHVHKPEYDAAMQPRGFEKLRYRRRQWAHEPRWCLNDATGGDGWFGFDAVRDLPGLPPEILAVPLYGHTRGHVGIAIDSGDGWLLHAGDAFLASSQIEARRGVSTVLGTVHNVALQTVAKTRAANLRRLTTLHQHHRHEVTVFSAHDANTYRRLAAANPAKPQGR